MLGETLKRLMKSKDSIIILSIIWGFGLACLFQRVCKGRNCIIYKAPSLDYIKGKIFKFNNKCYSYVPRLVKCSGNEILHD